MQSLHHGRDRQNFLADISEMYFLEGMTQAEIAKKFGMTRSNISRLLKEARKSNIIQIKVNRPIHENSTLSQKLVERFDLKHACIIDVDQKKNLLPILGQVAGKELVKHLTPGKIIATAWGTAISATVEQLSISSRISDLKVVQLLGALGARVKEYDAHTIVRRLEEKLDAEGIYFHAPFLVDDEHTAKTLREEKGVAESLSMCKKADVALLGVGSIDLAYCSYYLSGYVTAKELLAIQNEGAVGDVCAIFFDLNGEIKAHDFRKRTIGVMPEVLFNIPIRIGIAGGPEKVKPIIGALNGKLINILVSDSETATIVLEQTNK
jgi:deoxyribonucleoside regulator